MDLGVHVGGHLPHVRGVLSRHQVILLAVDGHGDFVLHGIPLLFVF